MVVVRVGSEDTMSPFKLQVMESGFTGQLSKLSLIDNIFSKGERNDLRLLYK